MKKLLLIFTILLSYCSTSYSKPVLKIYHTCGGTPHINGPNTYQYVHRSSDGVVTMSNGIQAVVKTITCDDPGSNDCLIPYVIPNLDENTALANVASQVSMGITSGEVNPNGTPGDGDIYNQDWNAHPFYTWEPTPNGCTKITMYYDDGE